MYKPARIGLIFIILAVMLTYYVSSLYRIQIFETTALAEAAGGMPQRIITRTVTLPAARGNIYDRNGILLASGRPSFLIRLDRNALLASGHQNMNNTVLDLVYITMDHGYEYTDTFPISRGAPFEYISSMSNDQHTKLDAYLAFHRLDPDISASDLLAWMRRHYRIDYTVGILDARLIIGVRYELELRVIIGTLAPYIFTSDISTDYISLISERGYVGVHAESTFIREYHTTYAAHLIGYIRRMSPEQFERLRELGYPMDALVGQIGAEFAFEEILRGIDGRQRIRTAVDGTVLDVISIQEPRPGGHVYLTIDIDLQIVVEHALQTQINIINRERELEAMISDALGEDDMITGGAVAVLNVRTGELLAAASYPTFNPLTLSQDFALLSSDPMQPMFNRATHGRYVPGSTFKMITGFAGLRHEIVGRYTPIFDIGVFRNYEHIDGFAPRCWIFPMVGVGHGFVDIVQALECSCNFYFMTVADLLPGGLRESATIIAGVAEEFGLGVSTGLEIPENPGRLSSPAWRIEAHERGILADPRWFLADTITTSFGQGDNRFTPVQLANYTATIANGGTLYDLTIVQRIMSSDFSERLHAHEPVVRSVIPETDHIRIIQEGMVAVSRGNSGTARSVFRDYPIRVGSKTGTAQFDERDTNDGVFVAYAPAENPQIAIAIVVEKGGSGSAVMDIARMIFDHYFRSEGSVLAVPYGELIP